MLKKTPLYYQHVNSNAKLVDFGGWEMPLHYGSQIEEHHQVRRDAGVFDVSHMATIDLTGAKVKQFLRYLLANDVGRLKTIGKALYSCMLNEKGGVIDDLIVYYQDDERFRMVVNAATKDKDIAWIMHHAKEFAVSVQKRDDLAMLAIQGPQASEKIKDLIPETLSLKPFHSTWNDWFIARTGYTGEDGFEIILPANQASDLWSNLLSNGIHPIGLGARNTLRLEAGMNLYGTDMDEDCSPLEAGLNWTVAWNPQTRDFIGRKALEAQVAEHRIMIAIVLQDKGILRDHQPIYTENGGEGYITSGSFSPTLGRSIAFARLPMGKYEQVKVRIRNKTLSAKVVKPPFIQHGKVCIDLT